MCLTLYLLGLAEGYLTVVYIIMGRVCAASGLVPLQPLQSGKAEQTSVEPWPPAANLAAMPSASGLEGVK